MQWLWIQNRQKSPIKLSLFFYPLLKENEHNRDFFHEKKNKDQACELNFVMKEDVDAEFFLIKNIIINKFHTTLYSFKAKQSLCNE